jgi:hypothetical protein
MCLVALVLAVTIQSAWAFYNPQAGRWLNRDPIGEKGGPNPYGFVHSEPLNKIDTDGREIVSVLLTALCSGERIVIG